MVAVALLTTGDEVVEGEILNTNAQHIAQILTDAGFEIGVQVSCRDNESTIKHSMSYLLSSHEVLIITGGLGPTADDRTRYAVSSFLDKPLVFHAPTWQWLKRRYDRLNMPLPETNRQQALFPKGADVISNEFGSADGAFMQCDQGLIFMLPGPPSECLPMLSSTAMIVLKKRFSSNVMPLLRWRVFGISESLLAQLLADNFSHFSKDIGYRWHYPYIDVKYRPINLKDAHVVKALLDSFLAQYIICDNNTTASALLKRTLHSLPKNVYITDDATGGVLQTLLLEPALVNTVSFGSKLMTTFDGIEIRIHGLRPYWQKEENLNGMTVHLEILRNKQKWAHTLKLDKAPLNVIEHTVELISATLNKQLR